MQQLRQLILRSRYHVLLTTLAVYLLVLVIEGAITGREARVIDFENPFFDLNIQDFDQFRESRRTDIEIEGDDSAVL